MSNRARKACKAILCTGTYPSRASGRARTGFLSRTKRAHRPVVLRWRGAGGESRTRGCRLTRPVRHRWLAGIGGVSGSRTHGAAAQRDSSTRSWSPQTLRTLGATRTRTDGRLTTAPLPLGYEGVAPVRGGHEAARARGLSAGTDRYTRIVSAGRARPATPTWEPSA